MRYYKVVRKTTEDGVYASSFVTGKASVKYKVGELATAPEFLAEKGYGLTVFDSLEAAKIHFANMGSHYTHALFRVSVVMPIREPLQMLNIFDLSLGRIKKHGWKRFPDGTVFVDGVILMEEVVDEPAPKKKASWESPCG